MEKAAGGSGKNGLVAAVGPAWFETRGFAALLTMRCQTTLILSSRLARVSTDEAAAVSCL
jgi:hypothetical protein